MRSLSFSRRTFLRNTAVVAGATTFGSTLAACGGSANSNKDITVTFWDWMVSQSPWIDKEIELFEKAHPGVKVNRVTQTVDKYADLFSLAVKGKNQPDIFMIPQKPDLPTQIANDWLKPVEGLVPDTFKERFPEGSFVEGKNLFDGKVYSAPLSTSGPWAQLFFDNAVAKQAGLADANGAAKLPKTWDDIIRYAESVQKKSNGSIAGLYIGNKENNELAWAFHMFTLAAGAAGGAWGVDYRTGKYTYGSDRIYQDTLEFLLEFKKQNLTNPDALTVGDELARVNFTQQKGGILIGGVWNMGGWKEAGYTDYSLTSLIPPEGTPKAYFSNTQGGTFVAIGTQSKHPDEAGAWFDWLYSKECGQRYVEGGHDLSAIPENNDPEIVKQNKPFSQYVKQANLVRFVPDPVIRNADIGQVKVGSITPNINELIGGIWSGQIPASDIHSRLSELEGKSNDALAKGVKEAQDAGLKVSLEDYIFADWDPTKDYITKPRS